MTTALQKAAAGKAKEDGIWWPKKYRLEKDLVAFVQHGTYSERWGAPEKVFDPPPFDAGSYSEGFSGMAAQVLTREAQAVSIDQLDQGHPPKVATMPEAGEDQACPPVNHSPEISATHTPETVDQDAVPWDEDASEDPKYQAPADVPATTPPREPVKGTFSATAPKKTKRPKKPKPGRVPIEGGMFLPLSFEELDSSAYTNLTGNASKVYGYLKRTARTAASNGGGVRERDVVFDYTYTEAKRRGFSESTFIRAIKELWAKGFIDVVQIGGLRGKGRTNSQYKLTAYWKTYGGEWKDRTRSQPDPFVKTSEPKNERDAKW